MQTFRKVIFSGIQPTGNIHLGNYFGAIKRWKELQDADHDSIFSIVDLHSITLPQDPKALNEGILKMTATLLACGINPQKSVIFQQSNVKEHAEFSWILKCITTMARLGRLAQFKEKSEKLKEVPLGLYVYPVLQAADILLYKTTHVPVGEDQSQHIQLAQDLQRVFNHTYKSEVLVRPTALISDGPASRVKSLRDPAKKMSKSDPDPRSYIGLTDPPELITNKFRKALTDFTSEVSFDPENRASVSNLILIESLSTGLTPDEICERNSNIDTGKYKLVVADSVIEMLRPIQNNYHRLINEKGYLISVLRDGAERARTVANKTLSEVKKVVGLSLEY